MTEVWSPVAGYESKYHVSNFGRIKSFCGRGERILTPSKGQYGHCRVQLYKDGVRIRALVHRLVAMAFVPGFAEDKEVNHIDFDPTNNHFSNLEWASHRQNMRHSRGRLYDANGEANGQAKLTQAQVEEIRRRYLAGGISFVKLGKLFGICGQQCHRIVRGQRWSKE